jgi:hypothetical protein
MNLKKIDTRQSTEQASPPPSDGLKIKSHVKAGLAVNRPIYVCG